MPALAPAAAPTTAAPVAAQPPTAHTTATATSIAESAPSLPADRGLALAFLGGLWVPLASLPDIANTIAAVLPSSHFAGLGWSVIGGEGVSFIDIVVLGVYPKSVVMAALRVAAPLF